MQISDTITAFIKWLSYVTNPSLFMQKNWTPFLGESRKHVKNDGLWKLENATTGCKVLLN